MFERCIYFNTNALSRSLNKYWEQAFKKYDLVPSHGYLLRLVLEKPGLCQQEISNELLLEKSTITRFLAVLETRGFIMREAAQHDPRQNAVFPTEQAKALHQDLQDLGDELYAHMCSKVGKANLKSFVTLTRTINGHI